MDNLSPTVLFLIFLTVVLLIILYRVFGHRHGHERKRDIRHMDPNNEIEDILKEIRQIVTEEKSKDQKSKE